VYLCCFERNLYNASSINFTLQIKTEYDRIQSTSIPIPADPVSTDPKQQVMNVDDDNDDDKDPWTFTSTTPTIKKEKTTPTKKRKNG